MTGMTAKIPRAISWLSSGLLVMTVCSCGVPRSANTGPFVAPMAGKPGGDYARLQGSWVVTSCEVNGVMVPEREGVVFHFEGNRHWITGDRGHEEFAVDAGALPKQIDYYDGMTPTIRGIYQIEGNELTECTADPGFPRPEGFASTFMSHTIVTKLRKR